MSAKRNDSRRVQANPFLEVKSQKVWKKDLLVGSYMVYTADCFGFFASSCSFLQDVGLFFSQNFSKYPIVHVQLNLRLAWAHSSVHVPPVEAGILLTALVTAGLTNACVDRLEEK